MDLVDTKTEAENRQREDTKQGILYDSTIVQSNVPKAMKSENKNEHFDVEGDVVKSELKIERGNDSELETVEYERISAEHEVLNVGKTAKCFEIKSENENNGNEKEEKEIGFSVEKHKCDLENIEKNVSKVTQRKAVKRGGKHFQCDICSKTFKYNANLKIHNTQFPRKWF